MMQYVYNSSIWIRFNQWRYYLYNLIDYLTYIQFVQPFEMITDDTETIEPINDPENIKNLIPLKKIEYEDKYKSDLLKYSEYLRKDIEIADSDGWKYLRNNILMENTPLGNVILYYDSVKDTFCYYSDRIIPYKYIDTVCRKYVIKFQCVSLYFDINNNTNVGLDKNMDNKNTESVNVNEVNNIFVKLKSYNKSNKGSVANTEKLHEIPSYINRYTYEGKLMNFNMLQKPVKNKFSYLDFKKVK